MSDLRRYIEEEINRYPFLEELIGSKLINISSLARKIHPNLETKMGQKLNYSAIIMAVKRIESKFQDKFNQKHKEITNSINDVIIRSNLCNYTIKKSLTLSENINKFNKLTNSELDSFILITYGVYETNFIFNNRFEDNFNDIFKEETLLYKKNSLSSLTLRISNQDFSGTYYFILKKIAWENISIVELVSTRNELSLIIKEEDIDKVFSVLNNI